MKVEERLWHLWCVNGARAKTVEGDTQIHFFCNGHDPIYQYGPNGKCFKYVYLGGRLELRVEDATEKYAYLSDALGSTRKVLSNGLASTPTFTAVTYKPFGIVYSTTGSEKVTFAGEIKDDPTGLFYLFARYYDPETGRFVSLDPELGETGTPQTLNRYVYCGNNPLIRTDPTGRFWNIIVGAIVGAIVGTVVSIVTQAATGHIDWGIVAAEAGIGAVTGALAGATMGASVFAGNVIAKGVTTTAPRMAQCAAKGAGLGMKALGAFSSGGISSAAGDVLRGHPVDWDKARWSGAFTLGMFGIGQAIGPFVRQTSLDKPLLSERWQLPNSKWNGYLFDERPLDSFGRPIGARPVSEGFHTNPSIFGIGFDFARAFGNKAFLLKMGFG